MSDRAQGRNKREREQSEEDSLRDRQDGGKIKKERERDDRKKEKYRREWRID